MAKYRNNLPQTSDEIFLTDGGLETTLIFHEGVELPQFMAFPLVETEEGVRRLRNYFLPYINLARELGVGFVFESATWRANKDWAAQIGYSEKRLDEVNRKAIEILCELRDEFETEKTKMVVSCCVGPRGDGYFPANLMSAEEAEKYHSAQIRTFCETDADIVSAFTFNYCNEAIGFARAAAAAQIPAVISFTVETNGKLPTGQTLREAIEITDEATSAYPAYYMINCAHPTHFAEALKPGKKWMERIRGIRANASAKSHAELDESTELDIGNPAQLGREYREFLQNLKNLRVLGGCCGTDFRHIKEIAAACIAPLLKNEFETV